MVEMEIERCNECIFRRDLRLTRLVQQYYGRLIRGSAPRKPSDTANPHQLILGLYRGSSIELMNVLNILPKDLQDQILSQENVCIV